MGSHPKNSEMARSLGYQWEYQEYLFGLPLSLHGSKLIDVFFRHLGFAIRDVTVVASYYSLA